MCKICIDYKLKALTLEEAWNNLRETFNEDDEHSMQVWLNLLEEEKKHET